MSPPFPRPHTPCIATHWPDLTPISRERLIRRHLDEGVPLKALAAEAGISLRSAYKWLARFRSGGPSALADRRSVRRHQRRTLDPQQLQQAVDLRHQRCTLRRIARALEAPLSTVGRVINSLGLGRLKNLEPNPVQRYQRERPGNMIHVDSKSWSVSSVSAIGSPATAVKAAHRVPATRKCTSPSITPHVWPTSRCSPTSKRRRPLDSWPVRSAGSLSRGSPAAGFFRITASHTAPVTGERPVGHWI